MSGSGPCESRCEDFYVRFGLLHYVLEPVNMNEKVRSNRTWHVRFEYGSSTCERRCEDFHVRFGLLNYVLEPDFTPLCPVRAPPDCVLEPDIGFATKSHVRFEHPTYVLEPDMVGAFTPPCPV